MALGVPVLHLVVVPARSILFSKFYDLAIILSVFQIFFSQFRDKNRYSLNYILFVVFPKFSSLDQRFWM